MRSGSALSSVVARRLLAVGLGLGIGGLVSLAVLGTTGVGPEDLVARLVGSPRGTRVLWMHELDDTIGYVLRRGVSIPHEDEAFRVRYHIDETGSRRVPGFTTGRPTALVLGDSWTFGHGVEDDETYAARLQAAWPDFGVRNLGVMGYGTAHVLLALECALDREEDVALVLYGWTPIHLGRSYLRASQIRTTAGNRTPRLEIENGRAVYRGLADSSDAIDDGKPGLRHAEWMRTRAALRGMVERSARRGALFVVVVLPGPDAPGYAEDSARLARMARRVGAQVVDLEGERGVPKASDLFFPDDGHPNARWHALVGEAIAARLDPQALRR